MDENLNKNKKILGNYLTLFKKIYYEPFFYKITSISPNEFYDLFFSNNDIINNLPKENNETYSPSESFKIILDFIYINVTLFYEFLSDYQYSSSINDLIKQMENVSIRSVIETDTNKRTEIIKKNNVNSNDDKLKFISVKNFINYVSIILSFDTNSIRQAGDTIRILNSTIYENLEHILSTVNMFKQMNIRYKDTSLSINKIDKIIENNSTDTILTFLKLRSDEGEKYNKRFNVKLYEKNNKKKILKLDYNDDNQTYYDQNKTPLDLTGKIPSFKQKLTDDIIMDENQYNNTYILGPVTEIYNYDNSNEDISNKMEIVTNSLLNGKPVFIMGYGASGSGKTSSLIYFNKGVLDKRNGILVHLCNIMAKKNYNKIQLKCREFYMESEQQKLPKVRYFPDNKDNTDHINFEFENNEFRLKTFTNDKNEYEYKNKYTDKNGDNKIFNSTSNLGEFIIHLIDVDRFVAATTNNKNSSRSHSLIFVTLINNDNNNKATLIIGDFAGVENLFNCNSEKVQEDFFKVERDNIDSDKENIQNINKRLESECKKKENKNENECKKLNDEKDLYSQKQYYLRYPIQELKKDYDKSFNNSDIVKNYKKQEKNIKQIISSDVIQFYENEIIKKILNDKTSKIIYKENELVKDIDMYKSNLFEYITEYINNVKDPFQNILKFINEINSIIFKPVVENTIVNYSDKYNKKLLFGIFGIIFNQYNEIQEMLSKTKIPKIGLFNNWKTIFEGNQTQAYTFIQYFTNVIIKNIFEKILENSKTEYDKNKELLYGKGICNIRRNEGVFINNSLKDIRDIINYIIIEKNKYKLTISPPFVDECLNFYCNKNICFKLNRKEIYNTYEKNINITNSSKDVNNFPFESLIFNVIYEEIKQDILKLIISVFCVFNISKSANNPPPTPYIDINYIKFLFFNKDDEGNLQKLKDELKNFTNLDVNKSVLNKFNNDTNNGKLKISKIIESNVFQDVKNIIQNDLSESSMNIISEFIEFIDNFNASSAIGTLEFLDAVSKYNTINNICNYKKFDINQKEKFDKKI